MLVRAPSLIMPASHVSRVFHRRGLFTVPSLLAEAAGWRAVPRAEAFFLGEALLSSTLRTPHRCYTLAGHFTVELSSPFAGAPALVLTPGYASGSALWAPVLDALAREYRVLAVDWLGTGASERPAWSAASVPAAESFFVDALARWADASPALRGGFHLAGHSLGGYLASAFALAHPRRVRHLLLVGPAGLARADAARLEAARARSWAVAGAARLWERGATPAALVRALGPAGLAATRAVVARRFAGALRARALPLEPLARYAHALLTGAASAEQALAVLLGFGAQARAPMGPRLLEAARAGGGLGFPVTLLFGESDWMDVRGGARLARALEACAVDAACAVVPGAGHFVFLEAPRAFERIAAHRLGGGAVAGLPWRA
jgi:pimeloyl-ACP methyl ester carboxylesterase